MNPYHNTYRNVHHHVVSTFTNIETWFSIPTDAWTYKPKDEGWTIGEILEHMTLTSHFLLIVIENGISKALKRATTQPIEMGESDLEALGVIGHPDAFPWMRPDHMVPTGQKTRDEIQVVMNQHFVQSILLLERIPNGKGSLHKVQMSVQELGKLDMYQWIFFLCQHLQRHTTELERLLQEWQATQNTV